MNDNLARIFAYLEKASADKSTMDDDIIEEAGEYFKKALKRQFNPEERVFKLRPSNLGKPLCQLQMDAMGAKKQPHDSTFKMRMILGDTIEAIFKAILKASKIPFEDSEQVEIKIGDHTLSGETDLYIDGKVDDVKSCSAWAYRHKFSSDANMKQHDTFGYVDQLVMYAQGSNKEIGGWWAINKATGEMTYLELELTEEEIKERLNVIQDKIEAIKNNKPFKRNFEAVEETFRGKKTGNKHLSKTCSFCEYKNSCWDDLEYKPQPASSAVNPPWHYYTEIAKATA
jgi:hypothetical protein